MKKILSVIVSALLALSLVACGQKEETEKQNVGETTVEQSQEEAPVETSEEEAEETPQETEAERKTAEEAGENYSDKNIIAASRTIAEYLSLFDQDLVGVASQKNMPEMYQGLPEVGSPRRLNLEMIVSLNPDLVVANESNREDIETALTEQGIDTLFLDSSTYDSVFENIRIVGNALGQEEKAEQIVQDMKAEEEEILKKSGPLKGKTFALLFGTGENFQLMTENTYLGNLLKLIGLENIVEPGTGRESKYIPYSLENVVAANPDFMLTLAHGNKEQAQAIFESEFEKDLWQSMPAIQEGRLIHLDDQEYPITGNIHVMDTLEGLIDLLLEASN